MEVDHEVDSSRERTTAVGGPGPLALPGKTLEWGGVNWTLDDMDMDMDIWKAGGCVLWLAVILGCHTSPRPHGVHT